MLVSTWYDSVIQITFKVRASMKNFEGSIHSPCWFLDIKFKEYSRTKNWVFKEYSKQVYFVLHYAGFAKSVPDFEICAQSLNYFDTILHYFPSKQKFLKGVFIIFKHFQQNFSFSRSFQVPLKSKIKFQGFSRTSRSSTNPVNTVWF